MQSNNIQLTHDQISNDLCDKKKQFPICILSDNIEFPRNIGGLFRIAEAFGVEKIYLSGLSDKKSVTASDLKIRKAARSTHKTVDFSYTESAIEVLDQLKQDGYSIISLEITSASTNIRQFCKSKLNKICLIIGSEKNGISQSLLEASDHTIHIAMYGQNSSMNVVAATAIALYELTNSI